MKLTFEIFIGVFAALALADWLRAKDYEYHMRQYQRAKEYNALFDQD